jgi:molecular chaperone GrpE
MKKAGANSIHSVVQKGKNFLKGSNQAEVEHLTQSLKEKEDLLGRTLAEFDNYKKRVAKEGEVSAKAVVQEVLLGILGVLDSFDRAFQSEFLRADPQVYQGVRSIYRQLQQLLEQHGITYFESIGQMFNPDFHEAVGTEPTHKFNEGVISKETQRGYVWEGKVLRHAKVLVVDNSKASLSLDEMA